MKTIAISIDEPTLRALDRLAAPSRGARGSNRSRLAREALQEYVARRERAAREAKERAILARHRDRLAVQCAALVAEQVER